ncbi:MAG: isoprenylcysteine carboxylmethyltransferase family protein [Gammaproteobacteria bacterium]
MWFVSIKLPHIELPKSARFVTVGVIVLVGLSLMFPAFAAFRKSHTTINPLKPEQATVLVTDGVFAFTRNPMYLSLSLFLIAYAVFLSSLPALIGPVVFFAFINRFQIVPEERALKATFGTTYIDYMRRVRRWL